MVLLIDIQPMKLRGRLNQCPACKLGFASLYAFDHHRIGPFGTGPLGNSPERRCLTPEEMAIAGWNASTRGFWMTPGMQEDQPDDGNAANNALSMLEPSNA